MSAWQDESTLQWSMFFDKSITVPNGVSVELEAKVEGSIPHSKTLVVDVSAPAFDLDKCNGEYKDRA